MYDWGAINTTGQQVSTNASGSSSIVGGIVLQSMIPPSSGQSFKYVS